MYYVKNYAITIDKKKIITYNQIMKENKYVRRKYERRLEEHHRVSDLSQKLL